MNEDEAGRTALPPECLTMRELLVRLATDASEVMENRVRTAILDEEPLAGGGSRYELADPVQERRGGAMRASLSSATLLSLEQRHGTILPWSRLVGAELDLVVQTTRLAGRPASSEIVDVEAGWVDRSADVARRAHLRSLASGPWYAHQRLLAEPTSIGTIGIMRPIGDPCWPSIAARSEALDVRCEDIRVDMRDRPGHSRVTTLLERMARGHHPTPDILLIVASDDTGLVFREQPDTASLASQMPCPVIVGFQRGRHGSLIHDVAFSASEDPSGAAETAWRMVVNARNAAGTGDRLRRHTALDDARRRRRR